jgi:hypothetical protein
MKHQERVRTSGTFAVLLLGVLVAGCGDASAPASPTAIGSISNAWTGTLPNRTTGTRPVCQVALPATAVCLNDLTGTPQAICQDGRYSCSSDAGVCSAHGGVYCWRN